MHEKMRRVTNRRKTTQTTGIMDKHDMCFEKEALVNVWMEYMGKLYADDRVTRPDIDVESGPSIASYIDRGETCHQKIKEQQSNWHRN